MMKKVLGIGAGGHARVMLDFLATRSDIDVVGIVDRDRSRIGSMVDGVPIIGGDDDLAELKELGKAEAVFIGVGALKDSSLRQRLYERAIKTGFEVIDVMHPSAVISGNAKLGAGVSIMASAIVNTGVLLGNNVLINSGAIVEHHCRIGDHSHVASGAILAGGVEIGRNVLIGAGAVVRQYIKIGDGAVIGAGAVVVKDVASNQTVVGVPARPL